MLCIDTDRLLRLGAAAALAALLVGCGSISIDRLPFPVGGQAPAPAPTPAPWPATPTPQPAATPARGVPVASDWAGYRLRAAQRITQANASDTYSGPPPEPLASIPVLQVMLNADGSVRGIDVLRVPKFEPQTVEMAKAAVMRAAPFGYVGNLPQPWQFSETFLYNDALKFKLRTIEEGR